MDLKKGENVPVNFVKVFVHQAAQKFLLSKFSVISFHHEFNNKNHPEKRFPSEDVEVIGDATIQLLLNNRCSA